MKKKTRLLLLICMAALLAFGALFSACAQAEEEVVILKHGMSSILSGAGAPVGIFYTRMWDMAHEDIGEFEVAGKKYRWQTVEADNAYTTQGGADNADYLAVQEECDFITVIGSTPCLGAAPILEEAGVLFGAAGMSEGIMTEESPYSFGLQPGNQVLISGLVKLISMNRPDIKTIVGVFPDDDVATSLSNAYQLAAEEVGIEIISMERHDRELKDFYPLMTRVVQMNPDAILLEPMTSQTAKAARELGYEGTFVYHTMPGTFIDEVGVAGAEGTITGVPLPTTKGIPQSISDWNAMYKAEYGDDLMNWNMVWIGAWPYMVTQALQKAGTVDDMDKIAQVLDENEFDTPFGSYSFGAPEEMFPKGRRQLAEIFYGTVQNGEVVISDTLSVSDTIDILNSIYGK